MQTIREQDIKNILEENLPWGKFSGKTVLISGTGGFIPSYIVDELLTLGRLK